MSIRLTTVLDVYNNISATLPKVMSITYTNSKCVNWYSIIYSSDPCSSLLNTNHSKINIKMIG